MDPCEIEDEQTPRRVTPFNEPSLAGNEMRYVLDAVARHHLSGNGAYTRQCEDVLAGVLQGARVLLTTSCTHALEMCALLLDVKPGDEVIVPAFTFVSTANAFLLRGARPVFVDIRPDTLNLDPQRLAGALTPRTRAIVPVHYAGIACDMDAIREAAAPRAIAVVEDNAHGLFGAYKESPLGTLGVMSALSFHETKNVFCGEGGAIVVNDPALVARAEILREKGTDRSRFFRGEVDRYTWLDVGSSYVMSELLAAFLYAQLEQRTRIQAARRAVWERYANGLHDWAARRGFELPYVPPYATPAYHLFHLVAPTAAERDALIAHLGRNGIQAVFHYVPLHTTPQGRALGGEEGQCPVAESISERLLRLPFYTSLTEDAQETVLDAVRRF